MITDKKLLGTAFGFAMSIGNIGKTSIPLIVGHLHDITLDLDNKFGYYSVSLFFIYTSSLACIYATGLYFYDRRNNSPLDKIYH